MREIVTTVTMRCDLCNSVGSTVEPIVTKSFTWEGQEREIDLCVLDVKEISGAMDALMEKSRRPEGATRRRTTTKKQPYSGDTRFNQWFDTSTQMFLCPATAADGEHKCGREFTTANGLAVHHKRQHGTNL